MPRCLFCPAATDGSEEHVILSAIGGVKSSTRLICSKCNGVLGSTIDNSFLQSLTWVTLMVDPPTRRRASEERYRILDQDGTEYELHAGGRLTVRHKKRPEGGWVGDASIKERIEEHARRAAEAITKRTGQEATLTCDEVQAIPAPIQFSIQGDPIVFHREFVKWALELLLMECLPDTARDAELLNERGFVMAGEPLINVGLLDAPILPRLMDDIIHYVLLVQSDDGSVYWECSAYGGILASSGRFPRVGLSLAPILYEMNAVSGKWSVTSPQVAAPGSLSTWSDDGQSGFLEHMQRALARVTALWNERAYQQTIGGYIERAMSIWKPGTVLTQTQADAIARDLAAQYVEYLRMLGAFE